MGARGVQVGVLHSSTSFPLHRVLGLAKHLGKCPISVIRGGRELSTGNILKVSWKVNNAGGGGAHWRAGAHEHPPPPFPVCGSLTATCPGAQRAQRPRGVQPRPVWLLIQSIPQSPSHRGQHLSARAAPPETCRSASSYFPSPCADLQVGTLPLFPDSPGPKAIPEFVLLLVFILTERRQSRYVSTQQNRTLESNCV